MMKLLNFLKKILNKQNNTKEHKIQENEEQGTYNENEEKKIKKEIISVWDSIKCNEHTQAFHLVSVIPFDEWIDMIEIKRRIWDLFQIEYKNDRSLYPYLKTMVDLGLIETSNIGGKRKWRKRDMLIKIEKKEKELETTIKIQN
jgi:hypothetical protein